MSAPDSPQTAQLKAQADSAAGKLAAHLGGPLLIMYYPDEAAIGVEDIANLYQFLRSQELTPASPLPKLNVALHTLGGDANASYRLAQLLRDFASKVTFIVPEQAYSGGTTITLAGDEIVLAHCAVLSPIDVGLVNVYDEPDEGSEGSEGERLEPVAMDHYIDMAANAKVQIESELQNQGISGARSAVDEALMTAMVVNPENAMRIAKYYRQRNIAETYARQLLENYMLKDASPAQVQEVIDGLITQSPDHEFDMDYHICSSIGLKVREANQELSDLSKELLKTLESSAEANVICGRKFNNSHERKPFFQYTGEPNTPAEPGEARQDEHDKSE